MKNFLFAIFAFASLMAMGMASPFDNGKTGLEVREDKDYSSHKQVIHGLMQEVMQQTGNISTSPTSSPTFCNRGIDDIE